MADIPIVGAPADRIVGNPVDSMDTISIGKHFPAPIGGRQAILDLARELALGTAMR